MCSLGGHDDTRNLLQDAAVDARPHEHSENMGFRKFEKVNT
jgi:hypothetical protein